MGTLLTILIIILKIIYSHKNHLKKPKINQINKHTRKMYNQCTYTLIIVKQFHNHMKKYLSLKYKKNSCLVNIRMINLSFDELRLIAQIRNISNYENKSEEDLIKALSEIKPETPKPDTLKSEKLKPETPKPETITSEKLKREIRVHKKKLKKLRKDFDELRHNFSKKKLIDTEKIFMLLKTKNIFLSEIKKTNKSFNKLKNSLKFKKFCGIDRVDYEDLDKYGYNYDFADDDEYRKIGSIRTLLKKLDRDYYKPIKTDSGFVERNDKYTE